MRTALVLAALAALAATSGTAVADELRQLRFHHGVDGVTYFVRTDTSSGAQVFWPDPTQVLVPNTGGTAHIAGDRELDIARSALESWNAAARTCGDGLQLRLADPAPVEVGFDRVNRLVFRDDRWCAPVDCDAFCGRPDDCVPGEACHDPRAAGLTTLCFNVTSGEILDADIEINGVNFAISDRGASEVGGRSLSDLANTLTHELGHFIGLDHTCWNPMDGAQPTDDEGNLAPDCRDTANLTPEIVEATMFATQTNGETKKATLTQDDIDALCSIYPVDDGGCGCAASGASDLGSSALIVLGLATLRRRRLRFR